MLGYQYDMFNPEPTENDLLKDQIQQLKISQDNLRKGLFKRHNDMMKLVIDLYEQVHKTKFKIKK